MGLIAYAILAKYVCVRNNTIEECLSFQYCQVDNVNSIQHTAQQYIISTYTAQYDTYYIPRIICKGILLHDYVVLCVFVRMIFSIK